MPEKITLSGVPETMLQTLYARARESQGRGVIRDKKAEELIARLDYDFSLAEKDTAMRSGVIARTLVLDQLVGDWLRQHPGAVVVNIACGLDTRCCRMSGYAHWYNLDLPETMAVRQRLLPESGAVTQIALSAILVILEGLTMYLNQADIRQIFAVIAQRFPKVTVLAETMNPTMARRFKEKSIEGSRAKFTFGVKDGRTFAALLPGFRYAGEHCLTEGMAVFVPIYRLLHRIPAIRDLSNRIVVLERG